MKKWATIYARLVNRYKFKNKTVFSAQFVKQGEDNQVLEKTDLFLNLQNNQNVTESGIDKDDFKSPVERQIQNQEMKYNGWRFDDINVETI